MARKVAVEKVKADCDICHGRKGKNREVYHILSFDDLDTLRDHLKSVFSDNHYCVEFFTTLWVTAHQIYGDYARQKYFPIWLVYLEAHGVSVKNRGAAIMKYRRQNVDVKEERIIESTSRLLIEQPKGGDE